VREWAVLMWCCVDAAHGHILSSEAYCNVALTCAAPVEPT
jgi:hypothetical protein